MTAGVVADGPLAWPPPTVDGPTADGQAAWPPPCYGAGISMADVSQRYATPAGPVEAVRHVSLDVAPGASVAVMGPSGCGKSTLLALIGGLEAPTDGRVTVGGRELSGLDEAARARARRTELGFVFQADNLQPFLTALENVALSLSLAGQPADLARGRALLERLGLAPWADRLPDQLSGGQRQRVAVARALVHRPRLVLADEPTGSLDRASAGGIVELLLDAQRQTGATLVVVTHDAAVAARLDRTITLRDGAVVADTATDTGTAGLARRGG
jgi:putative ABC transport system ATP-binding protein